MKDFKFLFKVSYQSKETQRPDALVTTEKSLIQTIQKANELAIPHTPVMVEKIEVFDPSNTQSDEA